MFILLARVRSSLITPKLFELKTLKMIRLLTQPQNVYHISLFQLTAKEHLCAADFVVFSCDRVNFVGMSSSQLRI